MTEDASTKVFTQTQKEVKEKAKAYQSAKAEGLDADTVYYFSDWTVMWFENHKDNIIPTTQENYTFAPELAPYVDQFNLYVLTHSDADDAAVRNDPYQFLYKYRYDVAYLYDVSIQWSKSQFEEYWNAGDGRRLNIQGS